MDGSLQEMGVSLAAAMVSPFPSDGSTIPLLLRTSMLWREKRLISSSSHLISFSWSVAALGFLLSMITLESPTIAVSTDPITEMTGNLVEYQASLPTYGTPSFFRCTSLIIAYKVALMGAPLRLQLFNLLDSDDSIIFLED